MLKFLMPWYLRWLFRLPWVIYIGAAAAIGYFAYAEYENYLFQRLEARIQISDGVPDPTPLSQWNATTDVTDYGEVNVGALYFTALPHGEIDPVGLEQVFILLAGDQGKEIKAVLVVRPDALSRLQRQLRAQGSGDSIAVTVNGLLNDSVLWADAIDSALANMGVPVVQDLVVIEPILGYRPGFLFERAGKSYDSMIFLGVIAGILAIYGGLRFWLGRRTTNKQRNATAKPRAPAAQHAKTPTQKTLPAGTAPEASPWGTFTPQKPVKQTQPKRAVPPKRTGPPKQAVTSATSNIGEGALIEGGFKSVFPSGGSGFRFKTADEIIRETFGTLSTVVSAKRVD